MDLQVDLVHHNMDAASANIGEIDSLSQNIGSTNLHEPDSSSPPVAPAQALQPGVGSPNTKNHRSITGNNSGNSNTTGGGQGGAAASRGRKAGFGGIRGLPPFTDGRKVLAVASSSSVQQVARSIAHNARVAEPPVLSAVGPASVNQAVKAIAIARTYLEANMIDLVVEVQRGEPGGEIKDLILLNLKKVAVRPQAKNLVHQTLKSAGKSGTSQLAGAIAKNVRDNKRVKITAVGQNPVFRAVDSIFFARKYLADDGLDLEFQPEFTVIEFDNGTSINAMQLFVLSHQI